MWKVGTAAFPLSCPQPLLWSGVSFKVRIPILSHGRNTTADWSSGHLGTILGIIQSKNDASEGKLSRSPCSVTQGGHSQAWAENLVH